MYDAIVVLAGGIRHDGTLPQIPRQRVARAVTLFNEKRVPVIMSGRWSFLLDEDPPWSEAQAMAAEAERLGVPADRLLREEQSRDTIGNAYFVKKNFLEPHGWHRIVLVTSDDHVPRASYIFRKVLGPQYTIVAEPVTHDFSRWQRRQRQRIEHRLFSLARTALGPVMPGNDDAVHRIVATLHPGLIRNPLLRWVAQKLVENTYH